MATLPDMLGRLTGLEVLRIACKRPVEFNRPYFPDDVLCNMVSLTHLSMQWTGCSEVRVGLRAGLVLGLGLISYDGLCNGSCGVYVRAYLIFRVLSCTMGCATHMGTQRGFQVRGMM